VHVSTEGIVTISLF